MNFNKNNYFLLNETRPNISQCEGLASDISHMSSYCTSTVIYDLWFINWDNVLFHSDIVIEEGPYDSKREVGKKNYFHNKLNKFLINPF